MYSYILTHLLNRKSISLGRGSDWKSTVWPGNLVFYFLWTNHGGRALKNTLKLPTISWRSAVKPIFLLCPYLIPTSLIQYRVFKPTAASFWKICFVCFSCSKGRHKASRVDRVRSHTKRGRKRSAATQDARPDWPCEPGLHTAHVSRSFVASLFLQELRMAPKRK